MDPITGLHHVTAVARDPQQNVDFYRNILGQRLVKRTVNFDSPGTYHFYFADETGTPGSVLTFFAWPNMRRGAPGNRETRTVAYNIPAGSLAFWQEHLTKAGVEIGSVEQRFGQAVLPFQDPDGMQLELVEVSSPPSIQHWTDGPIPEPYALLGFHSVTLWLDEVKPTAELLTQHMGFQSAGREENRHRFIGDTTTLGYIVDVVHRPGQREADFGAGSIHHIAFRVPDDQAQLEYQSALGAAGFRVTEVMDRNYFHSIYFRERGGVLFELATNPPGFLIDEARSSLGENLKLPEWFEPRRDRIESSLAPIELKPVQKADVA